MNPPAPHRVVVLALDPVVGYDLAIPPQLFRNATSPDGARLYDVTVAGLSRAPLPTGAGYAIVPDHGPEMLAHADTVVVPGTEMPGPRQEGTMPLPLADAFASIRSGTRLVSICTGAFVLAAAGLLDGRRATTHWAYAHELAALHPRVEVDPDVLFVDAGDVLTSAGLGAGVDLVLHVLRRDHGSRVANDVARYCVVPPWREGGQAQFIARQVPGDDDASTSDARAWALRHLATVERVGDLVRHAGMPERTFTRRFREETGLSPHAWLVQQRLQRARDLLESTDLPVERIAYEAGFATPAALRQHLRGALGLTPVAYRKTFRGVAARVPS